MIPKSFKSPPKNLKKSSENPQKTLRKSSEIHQKVLRISSGSHQKVFRRFSESFQTVLRKSSESPQKFIKKSSKSPQKLLKKSSKSLQKVICNFFGKLKNYRSWWPEASFFLFGLVWFGLVFSVWFTNVYLFETKIPKNTLYLSLFNNCLVPNTSYLYPYLLCTLGHKTWSIV